MKKKYIIVDLTDVIDPLEVVTDFAEAKVKAGENIQPYEFYGTFNYGRICGQWEKAVNDAVRVYNETLETIAKGAVDVSGQLYDFLREKTAPKKPNIFKRAWNWIKSKFKK